jgi:hypothetical protein
VVQIDGLHQVMQEAGIPGPLPVRFLPVPRQGDEPWLAAVGARRELQLPGDLVAVHDRQADVEQDDRGLKSGRPRERRWACLRGLSAMC